MGEYGFRRHDNAKIKIGTCESNYYVRYEDKCNITPEEGSCFGHFWRLPFPEEDGIWPGDYDDPFKGAMLDPEFEVDSIDTGIMQLKHESGVLVNIRCYHGKKLPDNTEEIRFFWNGKDPYFFKLCFFREYENKLLLTVRCKYCSSMWSFEWHEVLPYIMDEQLKASLYDYSRNNQKLRLSEEV